MTRKNKVKLYLIQNMSERKVSFRKRNTGLMKKLSKLSTFCDVDACAIILNPFNSRFDVWPSPPGVQSVLTKFGHPPELEQTKHMHNLETFTQEGIQKTRDLDFKNNLNLLNDMDFVLSQNIQQPYVRIKALKDENSPQDTPMAD
ncbi:hypothetical protein LIER_37642 [Lithospermum erythrorhizon]|uniref:MADS-box domain-containing protein n=1 Tax=Lithospermum erythrorhizon TaxID=34254 RepID=A0AAV3PQN3_LITER